MSQQSLPPTRRCVLSAGAVAVAGAGALTACSSDEVTDTASSAAGEAGEAAASAASGAVGAVVAQVADVPVGGATVKDIGGQQVVLSQPEAGTIEAFSAVCPHQGGIVAPEGDELVCPLHGSRFNEATGELIQGPATRGLDTVSVSVDGDGIVLD